VTLTDAALQGVLSLNILCNRQTVGGLLCVAAPSAERTVTGQSKANLQAPLDHKQATLGANLLSGVPAVPEYVYGEATPTNIRRTRHMKFRDLIRILEEHGFELVRQRGSHRTYKGIVGGQPRVVVVACHRETDDIRPGTLSAMIRQSGLPKTLFRG
jgi:predicted RNA binding protein YcfA (HicA-like mRNA interferase family)